MSHELETTLNGAKVTVHYEVETSPVDCYDGHSNREYTGYAIDVILESVTIGGGKDNFLSSIHPDDVTELEMACTTHYDEVAA